MSAADQLPVSAVLSETQFRLELLTAGRMISQTFLHSRPLQEAVAAAFGVLLQRLSYLLGYSNGVHIVMNPLPGIGGDNAGLYHFLGVSQDHYTRVDLLPKEIALGIPELDGDLQAHLKDCFCSVPDRLQTRLSARGRLCRELGARFGSDDIASVVVRLSGDVAGSQYNLGLAIFWNPVPDEGAPGNLVNDETFAMCLQDLRELLVGTLVARCGITPETYLPDYRRVGPNRVAVMFADIRGFTTITEVLRSRAGENGFRDLCRFMDAYCGRLGVVVGRWGRIDKFMGDGMMALFGEYTDDKAEMCGRALICAKEMLDEFEQCKREWLSGTEGQFNLMEFRRENNAHVDLHLGIGLNVGDVFFGYYGAPGVQEYTAIGDHVNFAQRLESRAAQLTNEERGTRSPPIVMSQAFFWNCTPSESSFLAAAYRNSERCAPAFIPVKGLGGRYPVYMLNGEDVNSDVIRAYLRKST